MPISKEGYKDIHRYLTTDERLFERHIRKVDGLECVHIDSASLSNDRNIDLGFVVKSIPELEDFYKCSKGKVNALSESMTKYSNENSLEFIAGFSISTRLLFNISMPAKVYYDGMSFLDEGEDDDETESEITTTTPVGEGSEKEKPMREDKAKKGAEMNIKSDVKDNVTAYVKSSSNRGDDAIFNTPGGYPHGKTTKHSSGHAPIKDNQRTETPKSEQRVFGTGPSNSQITSSLSMGRQTEGSTKVVGFDATVSPNRNSANVDGQQEDGNLVNHIRKTFMVFVPNYKDRIVDYVKITSKSAQEFNKNMKYHHDDLYEVTIDLPIDYGDHLIYSYEVKFTYYRLRIFEREEILFSSNYKVGDQQIHRDIWAERRQDSISAHLLDIINHCCFQREMSDLCMQIERVCSEALPLESAKTLIKGMSSKIRPFPKCRALFAVALGNNLRNKNVIYQDKLFDVQLACDILSGLRDFKLTELSRSCLGYMPSVCISLCKLTVKEKPLFKLIYLNRCYPFYAESSLQNELQSTNTNIAPDNDDMLDEAVDFCRKLYKTNLSQSFQEATQSSPNVLLEMVLRRLPLRVALHVYRFLRKENNQTLTSQEDALQTTIYGCITTKIQSEMNTVKKGTDLRQLVSKWKLIVGITAVPDNIKANFEKDVLDMLKRVRTTGVIHVRDVLKDLCYECEFFGKQESQQELLTVIAESQNLEVHDIFIALLNTKLFQEAIVDLENVVFKTWYEKACATHARTRSRAGEDELLYMLSCLSDLLSVQTVRARPELQTVLEEIAHAEIKFFKLERVLRKAEDVERLSETKKYAGIVFKKLVQDLIRKKCAGQKSGDVMLSLVGTKGGLRINSSFTADIVCTILDVYCDLSEASGSIIEQFPFLMKNDDLWKLVFSSTGKKRSIVEENKQYKKAHLCLAEIVKLFQKHDITYSFFHRLSNKVGNAKDLIIHGGCTKKELNKLWNEAEVSFKEEIERLTCVTTIMNEVEKCICNEHTPIEFRLPESYSSVLHEINQLKLSLVRGEITIKDLISKHCLWTGIEDLPVTCKYLESRISSQVFWNICTVSVCEEFLKWKTDKAINNQSGEESPLEDVCVLFGEMQVDNSTTANTEDRTVGCREDVRIFLNILLQTGVYLYKEAWQEIQENHSLGMTYVMAMFRNVNIPSEIELAQQCLQVHIKDGTKTTLLRISKISELGDTVEAMKSSLQAFDINFDEDYTFLEAVESYERLLKGDSSDFSISDIRLSLQTVFDIANGLSTDTINILSSLGKCSSLLSFLKTIVEEDIRNLIDAVEDISEQHVRESTVSGLIEVKRFLHPLLRPDFDRKGRNLFRTVEKQTQAHLSTAGSLPAKIEECMDNLHNLKSLYNNVANRGEQTKETIENIVNRGRFHFSLDTENDICDFKASYKQAKKLREYRTKVSLVDLRSRALLLMNTERTEMGKHLKNDELERFIGYIDVCLEIADIAYNLQNSGNVKYIRFTKVEEPSGLLQLKRDLDYELKHWLEYLHAERNSHFLMNFVQGIHIHTLYNYLEKDLEMEAVDTLLKFIHPELQIRDLRAIYLQEKSMQSIWDDPQMLRCIGHSLHLSYFGLELYQREILLNPDETKRITDVVQNGKLLVAHLEESSLLVVRTILALFANTTHKLPEANQVLICSRETGWGEIKLFLGRCLGARLFYGTETLFCIANVEMLPNEIQFKVVESLRHLKLKNNFLLAVVCRGSKNHPFIDELSDYVMNVRPSSDQSVSDILSKECPHVCTYTSEIAGLGKTNVIYKMAHNLKKKVASLHISGAVRKQILIERLCSMKITKHHLLHLDIGNVDNHVELDTFLFELIILRHVTAGTVSVSLPTSHISIEIANTIKDSLRNSLQTAVSFRREHLKWNNYNNYIVCKEIQSPVQVVCHFLHCLEKDDLDKKDVSFNGNNVVTPLSTKTCKMLLKKYINATADLSFSIVNIFLNVLADQLKKMSCSAFFRTSRIIDMIGHKTVPTVRTTLTKALIDVSQEFCSRSVHACRSTQTSTLASGDFEESDQLNKLDLASSTTQRLEGMIQWEESNHLIYVFHNQNIQTISPMYRDRTKVPHHIKNLFEGQMKKELQDYKSMNQEQLQIILQKIARTNPMPLPQNKMQELASGYALTPDNLLKMVLIMLRIKARIPVIIMGETGCGKTSLIRYLAGICEVPFDVMNIHAGIEEAAIIDRVMRNNTEALDKIDEERWLFLDEINTCEHLGLISDVVCHHRCLGISLAPNLIVMGACNPYKLRSTTSISTAGLQGKVKTDELSRLVYRVLPLPEMLVDYVWDFGSLSSKDEEIYIKRMVEDVFPGDKRHHALLSDLLSMSQEFVRDQERTSYSVSLRDVQRCKSLTVWFFYILKKRSETSTRIGSYSNIPERAMILSLAHCYHSRFYDKNVRREYRSNMADEFQKYEMETFTEEYIHELIKGEQKDFLDRMELPPGTAKNTALRENVFVILVCILNKMPIFVVGKPGCSKSLAMQIIRSNLRGKDSKDPFFKSLQQLYCVSFQGSESSTSDGIIKVFEKAEKYQETNSKDEVLSVVILDEIGLAEISRFNPLKVLHNLLEPDGQSVPNVAVVGISNWSLDASKMNRAIHLSRPEMDEDELYETGVSISDSFMKPGCKTLFATERYLSFDTSDIKVELKGIAKSYFCYIKQLRFKNFHGLRDFYSLVKYIARELSEEKRKLTEEERSRVIMLGIERNFGGLPIEKETLLNNFQMHLVTLTEVQIPVVKLIKNNIEDKLARHLMLITTGESVLGIVEENLTQIERVKKEVIFGSQFEEDLTDDYNYRILSRIILCMEQGLVLILKDLENIYGSLYDMLNQNYTVIGKKKNCRVALGPYSNPICHVADTFRCIVLVDERKLDFTDPPFLNRFEKHYLRFADIISDDQEQVIESLETWINGLSIIKGKHFSSTDTFPIYSEDMVASLILKLCKEFGNLSTRHDRAIFLTKCKTELLWVIRPEVVIRLEESVDEEIQNESDEIRDEYFRLPVHNGMEGLMAYQLGGYSDKKKSGLMTVVFTNSNIHTKVLQNVTNRETQVDKLGAFKSEKQLSLRMQRFWLESDAEILFLQCSAIDDEKHIMLAKSVIERYRYEFSSKQMSTVKHVYLVIHMDRSKGTSRIVSQINFLSDWRLVMLDCLECPRTPIPELCSTTLHEIIIRKRPLNQYIAEQLFWTFTRIGYTNHGRNVESIRNILEKMKTSREFLEILDQRICKWIGTNHPNIDDARWTVQVACDSEILQTSSSFVEALESHILSVIDIPLSKTVYRMEVMNIIDSYFVDDFVVERRKTWEAMLDNDQIFSIQDVPDVSRNLPEAYTCESKDLCLKMPFSHMLFENVEATRDDFLDSLTLLKGKCDLDEDEDLPPEIFNELLIRHESFVIQRIPDIRDCLYETWGDDYIDDFCNIVSHSACSSLPTNKRIEYMKWAILQKTDLTSKDPSELLLRLHSTFWAHTALFHAELQLLETCRELLLDDKDELMQTLNKLMSSEFKASEMNTDEDVSYVAFKHEEEMIETFEDPLISSSRLVALTPTSSITDDDILVDEFVAGQCQDETLDNNEHKSSVNKNQKDQFDTKNVAVNIDEIKVQEPTVNDDITIVLDGKEMEAGYSYMSSHILQSPSVSLEKEDCLIEHTKVNTDQNEEGRTNLTNASEHNEFIFKIGAVQSGNYDLETTDGFGKENMFLMKIKKSNFVSEPVKNESVNQILENEDGCLMENTSKFDHIDEDQHDLANDAESVEYECEMGAGKDNTSEQVTVESMNVCFEEEDDYLIENSHLHSDRNETDVYDIKNEKGQCILEMKFNMSTHKHPNGKRRQIDINNEEISCKTSDFEEVKVADVETSHENVDTGKRDKDTEEMLISSSNQASDQYQIEDGFENYLPHERALHITESKHTDVDRKLVHGNWPVTETVFESSRKQINTDKCTRMVESDVNIPPLVSTEDLVETFKDVDNMAEENTKRQTDTHTLHQDISFGATALLESVNVYSMPKEEDQSPEEILVDLICRKMLPSAPTLDRFKNVSVWQSKTKYVLALAAEVTQFPISMHTLRFCNDMAAGLIIPFGIDDSVLRMFGEILVKYQELDSEEVFQTLLKILDSAPPEAKMECQRIISSYFIRCLTSNPNTLVMSSLLNLVSESSLPKYYFALLRLPLNLALQFETDENADILYELLYRDSSKSFEQNTGKSDIVEDVNENEGSSFLDHLDKCVKDIFTKGNIDSPFVVLIVDLLEDIYVQSFTDESLICEEETEKHDLFLKCHKIVIQAAPGLQYIASIAYMKIYISSFVQAMDNIDPKAKSFKAINAVLETVAENHISSSLLGFFLKAIGIHRSISRTIKYCRQYENTMQFLQKIQWNEAYRKSCFDSCPLSTNAPDRISESETVFESQDENKVRERLVVILTNAGKSRNDLITLFSLAMNHFYIPRSYMTLDDTTKRHAFLLIDEAYSHSFKEESVTFLKCLVGRKDFRVLEFMHGEGSEPSHTTINIFLTSLFALLIANNTFADSETIPVLIKCLMEPSNVMDCYLPGFPESDSQTSDFFDGMIHSDMTEKLTPETGYISGADTEGIDLCFTVRGMSPVVCNILLILVKGCLLGSISLGFTATGCIEEVTSIPAIDVSHILWQDVERHWLNISRLLNMSVYSVGLFLHTVLRHTRYLLCENKNPLATVKDRLVWENEFSGNVNEILKNHFQMMYKVNKEHVELHKLSMNCIESCVYELDDLSSMSQTERRSLTPSLFRIRSLPTMDNFLSELHTQRIKFPFLVLVLKHCESLDLPVHIFNIVQWHITATSNANYMMKKHECLNMKVRDFVIRSGHGQKNGIVRKRFDAFQKTWNEIKDNVHIGTFERIHASSDMSKCLILGTDSVVYRILQKLVAIQNSFLKKTLEMASECFAVHFISREPNVELLPTVQLSEVKKQNLLDFKWDDGILEESQSDLSYGSGRRIVYDFHSIEKALAVKILVGKSYISLENSFPKMIFTDELYRNYCFLISELKKGVRQECLPSEMIVGVKERKENDPSMTTELLSHLGVIMTLLRKTKGDPEKSLIDYAEDWKLLLTKTIPKGILPSPQGNVKLCHIVALHELLEELNSDVIIDALEEDFREHFDIDLENHLETMTKENSKLAEMILKAIKRFTHRCLSLREADAKQPLLSYLSDESFWPDGAVKDYTVHAAGKIFKLTAVLPESLMVSHVYATVTFIEAELESQKQDDMTMSKLATNWKNQSKATPVSKTVKKRKMATKKRKY